MHHGMRLLGGLLVLVALVFFGFVRATVAAPVMDDQGCLGSAPCRASLAPTDATLNKSKSPVPLGLSGFVGVGASYVSAMSSAAQQLDGSVTPIPAPAAIWLLLAGLGALGAFRRRQANALPSLRHGGDIEPARVALRGGAADGPVAAANAELQLVPFRRLRALPADIVANSGGYQAFAKGQSSPARPCGGAGNLYAATAERAPPVRTFQDDILGSLISGSRGPTISSSERPSQGIGFAARFLASDVWTPVNQNGFNPASRAGDLTRSDPKKEQ